MVDRHDTEVVLEVDHKETNGHIRRLLQIEHDFGADHDARILAILKLRDVNNLATILNR